MFDHCLIQRNIKRNYCLELFLDPAGCCRRPKLILTAQSLSVFLLAFLSCFRVYVMWDLAQPIAPSALSAFRTVGRSVGAALRAAFGGASGRGSD